MFKFALLVIAIVCLNYATTQRVDEPNYPPQPYNFQSETVDEFGTTLTRSEQGDGSGTVTGSYSYRDADGVYRIVDYVADKDGYRANIRTNEPGTGKDENGNPADTNWEIEPPPPGVVEKYLKAAAPTGRRNK